MKKIAVLLFIISITLISCNKNSIDYSIISFETTSETPKSGEFETFIVTIPHGNQADKITLYLNMEGMNHPMEGTMKRQNETTYSLSLPIAMGGHWYAIIRVFDDEDIHTERFDFEAIGTLDEQYIHGYDADEHDQ